MRPIFQCIVNRIPALKNRLSIRVKEIEQNFISAGVTIVVDTTSEGYLAFAKGAFLMDYSNEILDATKTRTPKAQAETPDDAIVELSRALNKAAQGGAILAIPIYSGKEFELKRPGPKATFSSVDTLPSSIQKEQLFPPSATSSQPC